jgi:hypothetical protein
VPLRSTISIALLAVLALAASAAAAPAGKAAAPGLVHRGQMTAITFRAPQLARACSAQLRYADAATQNLPSQKVRNHMISFRFQVPATAAIGNGTWSIKCNNVAFRKGTFIVVDATSTTGADVPRVVVDKSGYSQRPDKTGPGSQLSFGLILRNTSTTQDAENVYVIVNMVASDGQLIGSKSQTIKLVPAGGTYDLGDYMALRTQVQAVKLEITVRVGAHEPKQTHLMPDFANVKIFGSTYDPGWVGEVDGEIVNNVPGKTLQSATLSVIVFDAGGNIIGGGTAYAFYSVPSGSRFVFLAQQGFTAIPLDKAVSTAISPDPTWMNGG